MNGYFSNVFRQIQLKARYGAIDKIYSHLTSEEKLTLVSLACASNGTFVEVGSYLGSSSCFIAEGIMQSERER